MLALAVVAFAAAFALAAAVLLVVGTGKMAGIE